MRVLKRAISVAAILVLLAALLGTMSMAEMQWTSPWSKICIIHTKLLWNWIPAE